MTEHPIPRYRAPEVLKQRWFAQPNDIVERRGMPAFVLGGSWCVTLEGEQIDGRPMLPGEGAHIVLDFCDEDVAKEIVALHNGTLDG